MHPDQECDYLILGGGSAGCVLAARLSEDSACRVALVEAGGGGSGALIDTPVGVVAMLPTRLNNWAFHTVPQPGLNGRRGYQPRGRALGGSSATNAMVYMRGHPSDYEHWAALGSEGWGWNDVLRYFKRAEHNEVFAGPLHGQGGPLNVAAPRTDNPFHEHWLQAAREMGWPVNDDFNGAQQDGLGIHQLTQKNGARCSAFHAYLQPVLQRPHLRVLRRARACGLLFDGRRVVGAEVRQGGRRVVLHARREVIVCAGALQSPQLLMVSGIGDPAVLREHGIAVRHALPGVGRNLQDHVDFVFAYRSRNPHLMGVSPTAARRVVGEFGRWRAERRGLLTSNFAECGGFIRKNAGSLAPDFQLLFVVALVDDHARRLHLGHGFSCHLGLLRPRSRGTVSLAGPTMDHPPCVDPRYYADERDLDDMVQGFKLTRSLLRTPALARHATQDLFTADVRTDDDIRQALRQRSDTVYHPVGSCRMGHDALAVVDAQLRVHGIGSLRVVDASIMPTIPGGNTNAPTIMIAEKAADLIRAGRRSGS
jgi:choline dehydrogenase-like flavoprotein